MERQRPKRPTLLSLLLLLALTACCWPASRARLAFAVRRYSFHVSWARALVLERDLLGQGCLAVCQRRWEHWRRLQQERPSQGLP